MQLAMTFYDSIAVRQVDYVGGLSFEEFWETLVRISLQLQLPAASSDDNVQECRHTLVRTLKVCSKPVVAHRCSTRPFFSSLFLTSMHGSTFVLAARACSHSI